MAELNEPAGGGKPKPRPKPKRAATVYEAAPGRWVLTLTTWPTASAAQDVHYHLTMTPSDLGGVAFKVAHLEVDGGWIYDVHIGGHPAVRDTCTCPGFTYHPQGKPCKHLSALKGLIAAGKLPAPPTQPSAPAQVPVAQEGWCDL